MTKKAKKPFITKNMNELDQRIIELNAYIKEDPDDGEVIHGIYDDILELIAQKYDPKLFKKLKKMIQDVEFWYA